MFIMIYISRPLNKRPKRLIYVEKFVVIYLFFNKFNKARSISTYQNFIVINNLTKQGVAFRYKIV